jgi:hypothetical protein
VQVRGWNTSALYVPTNFPIQQGCDGFNDVWFLKPSPVIRHPIANALNEQGSLFSWLLFLLENIEYAGLAFAFHGTFLEKAVFHSLPGLLVVQNGCLIN